MEEQSAALLATLRKSSTPIETKLAAFNKLKSDIKHLRVPEAAQPTIFDCVRVAISAQTSPTLVSSGFSTLGHLIKRLSLQEQDGIVAAQAPRFLSILLERLGDAKESHRNAASQGLADFWPYSHAEVEKAIREVALSGNNARAKEMGMMWVVKMHREQDLQFRSFVTYLVANLEDADGGVRETAKSVVVELFSNAPDHAKADLKKQMAAHDVRKTISSFVTTHLNMGGSMEASTTTSTSTASLSRSRAEPHLPEPRLGESALSEHIPDQEGPQLEPLYIHTQRELEDLFRDMQPHFEGRESEHNWLPRDKSVTKIRRMLVGNAPSEFHTAFMLGIKGSLEGILKVANSLRTTHSTNGCQLVQELVKVLGPALDPSADIVLQSFIKMSANTKPIAANNGNTTVNILLSSVSYNKRLMEHMWFSMQDKNVQTRTYAAGWLKTLIKKHGRSKAQIEHSGGLELAEKFLKKGLGDANPKVREGTRATYWAFAQVWPGPAESIMSELDAKSKQLLEKDPNNPNTSSMASSVSSVASARSKPGAFNGRQSVRDAIAAQKKAMAAKLERPTSAASVLSTASNPMEASASTSSRSAVSRNGVRTGTSSLASKASTPNLGAQTSGSLMAAPVRRPRRPEVARPATADPYAAGRRNAAQVTPTASPGNSPSKAKTATAAKATARTPAPRPTTPAAQSAPRTKSRLGTTALPRPSPKSKTAQGASPMSTPKEDTFTMVNVPFTQPPDDEQAYAVPPQRRMREKSASVHSTPLFQDDDNFTMVGIQSLSNHRAQAFDSRPGSSGRPSSSGSSHIPVPTGLRSSPSRVGLQGGVNSPLQRLRGANTPRSPQTPASQNRRMEMDVDAEPVQIYEDPMTPEKGESVDQQPHKPVLEELPLNERAFERASSELSESNQLSQSTRSNEQNIEAPRTPRSVRSHHKTTSTGSVIGLTGTPGTMQANAEVFRSRRLIASGIERIRSRTLDAHGFRKVQEIIKTREDIWGDDGQKYGELLIALLDHLESPSKEPAAKTASLKIQILATIRAMLAIYKPLAAPYHSRALCSVLYARRQFDDSSHISTDVEKTAAEIVAQGQPSDCLNAVLDLVDSISAPTSPTSNSSNSSAGSPPSKDTHLSTTTTIPASNVRTVTLSLTTLGLILQSSAAKKSNPVVSPGQEKRLGALAVRFLQDTNPDVRKADLEFCLVAHDTLGREAFWRTLTGAKEAQLNLVTYYLARRGRA